MRAYHLEEPNRIEGIVLREHATPAPGPTELLVRVHAASLNRRDQLILHQVYPLGARPGVVPLSDGAGEVVAIGERVTRFKVGDRVTGHYFPRWRAGRLTDDTVDQLGCTLDGMAADHVRLDEQWAVRLPEHLSWEEAACMPCAGVTAWCAVAESPYLRPGATVVTLGTGDVSLFAVQFAKLAGCRVIATTSHAEGAATLRALGADEVIDYVATPRWGEAVRALTQGQGADIVVDTMGPSTIEQSLVAAARYSEVVVLIWRDRARSALVLPAEVYGPRLTALRRLFVGPRVALEAMLQAIDRHRLHPVIGDVFPFDGLHEAYARMDRKARPGKLVVRIP